MDLHKAKILLDKINSLHRNISMDENHIAAIEKDLMLNYIRQLYECYLIENSPVSKETPVAKKQIREEPRPKPKVVIEESIPEPVAVKKVSPVVPPPKPRVVEKPKPVRVVQQKEKVIDTTNDFDLLFEHKQGKELSDKLSALPIKDLTKAMGLNEKIFTINELFDGDKTVFEETMLALNGLRNFEEAKTFLSNHIARQYNWMDKSKKKKAKEFIKLIRRRYN
ncbi:MAG TPA: hypothetical protein ENK52_00035 [Saprospiraceae bacterium]|nr:hypothetical protein [Saprospiraceae bacterium]